MFIYSPKSRPSARIERWVLRLQPYDFTVKHIPGSEMAADALSRLIMESDEQISDRVEEYVRLITMCMSATPKALTTREIEQVSDKDEKLKVNQRCLLAGNWDKCPQ